MATIPPWLNVQPSDFSGALLKGLQTGLSIAEMRNQTTENQANRQAAWDKAQEAAALAVWERQQQAELEREKLAQEYATERARLAATEAYRQGELGIRGESNKIDREQLAEAARHNLAVEAKGTAPRLFYNSTTGEIAQVSPAAGDSTPAVKVLRPGNQKTNFISPTSALNIVSDPLKSALLEGVLGNSGVSNLVNVARSGLPQAKRIRVKSPDGKIGTIPEGQLSEAVKLGYTIYAD